MAYKEHMKSFKQQFYSSIVSVFGDLFTINANKVANEAI